jgi:DNA mismatch repair protein MutS
MTSEKSEALTPMMRQYMEVRRQLPPRTLLLFRLGDFYEMFDEDARLGSQVLGITLTQRNNQPMAGIPHHAADNYIQKMLAAGYKVAICDQMEAPKPGKIVRRELTRILSPGTALEEQHVESKRNNFLLGIYYERPQRRSESAQWCLAWLELGTGQIWISSHANIHDLLPIICSLNVTEWVFPEELPDQMSGLSSSASEWNALQNALSSAARTPIPGYYFDYLQGKQIVLETLGVHGVEGFGIDPDHSAMGAAGAILQYAANNLCSRPGNIRRISVYRIQENLLLDPATQRNLEIFKSYQNSRNGTLLEAMDATVTAPGARLLETWLTHPLIDLKEIRRRQLCVGEFLQSPGVVSELQDYLKQLRDMPRMLGRLQNQLRNPRELGGIRDSLLQIPLILDGLIIFRNSVVDSIIAQIQTFPDLSALLQQSLAEELPNQVQEGGYICDGFDEHLDEIRSLKRNSRQWLNDLELAEQERTGIRKLKIKYTNAFGFYIEITKANLHLVPDNYIRRQTTVNAERYYTPELKDKEEEILHADERAIAREIELFRMIAERVLKEADQIRATADALAELDVLMGWARIAREYGYCCPQVDDGFLLNIVEGRHPVVERILRDPKTGLIRHQDRFVPNDTALDSAGEQIALVTGPNMAGKSTYIRQIALITLMAHTGSWVPARECSMGLVDRIFSRVGASDELTRGNSTFMVEMNETANILNNATERSLIILDEIGRGTSTYDGLSIAWAVVEYLHGNDHNALESPFSTRGPRTLFATHYHELTQISRQLTRVANYSVAVREWNDQIIFVREVVKGAADRSYGIQVARLAGIPLSVIQRAREILNKLESEDSSHNLLRQRMHKIRAAEANHESPQLELF